MQIDRNKIVKGLAIAGGAICSVVLSAFGINMDSKSGNTMQDASYPEELFEKYKYK